jgi:cytochrome P450 family 9
MFQFRTPFFFLRDPDLIKHMAIKDFDHFTDHRGIINPEVDPMFGASLFSLTGTKWKHMRSSLSPIFTGSKMRHMFQCVSNCGASMVSTLRQEASVGGAQTYEVKETFARFTNDVIASTAFGIEVNSFEEKDNDFFTLGKRISNFTSVATGLKIVAHLFLPWLMRKLNIHVLDNEASMYFQRIILDNFNTRESKNIVRNDLIQLLLKLRRGEAIAGTEEASEKIIDGFATVEESDMDAKPVRQQWTDQELMAQCFVFFLAGFDTSSTLLSFAAYELATNPDVQTKLFREIEETNAELNGKKVTYEALQTMKYMDQVVSEALRKWPPMPITDRICVKDYRLQYDQYDFPIKAEQFFIIPIYSLHHDPKYWPNPDKFDPDRFSDENKGAINSSTYLPFGIGPRNCIGSRFALMEVKAVLYYLLLNFSFEVTTRTQVPIKLEKMPFGLKAEGGIHLEFRPRPNN